jgi:segregation and condensation protein A
MPSESENLPSRDLERPDAATPAEEASSEPPVPEAEGESGGYRVRLPEFEGPLDLLLHLIRINEIDVTDIPIVDITRQYNETLDLMRELNLEVAGEYLVMAATLLHIKSRMLLPPDPLSPAESPADPRSELARQIEEYQRYRQAALRLAEAEAEGSRAWIRPASLVAAFEGEAAVEADLFSLLTAFKKMLDSWGRQEQELLRRDRISLLDRIQWILGHLEAGRRATFSSLFEGAADRPELIVTFLALLELVRLRVVGAVQSHRFSEIEIVLLEEPGNIGLDTERILDA